MDLFSLGVVEKMVEYNDPLLRILPGFLEGLPDDRAVWFADRLHEFLVEYDIFSWLPACIPLETAWQEILMATPCTCSGDFVLARIIDIVTKDERVRLSRSQKKRLRKKMRKLRAKGSMRLTSTPKRASPPVLEEDAETEWTMPEVMLQVGSAVPSAIVNAVDDAHRKEMRKDRMAERKKRKAAIWAKKKAEHVEASKPKPKPLPQIKVEEPVQYGPSSNRAHRSSVRARRTRAEREEYQRMAAMERKEKLRKSVPKAERARAVRAQRDKRNSGLELQSGKLVGAAVGAGLFLLHNGISKLVRNLSRTGEDALETIKKTKTELVNVVGKVQKEMCARVGKLFTVIPLAMAIFYIFRKCELPPIVALPLLAALLCKVCGRGLWDKVREIVTGALFNGSSLADTVIPPKDDGIRLQSINLDTFAPSMSKIFSALFVFSVFKGNKPGKFVEVFKRIAILERAQAGWEGFIHWVLSVTEKSVNWLRARFGKADRIQLYHSAEKPVTEWVRKVNAAACADSIGEPISADKIDELVELVRQGYTFKNIYMRTKVAPLVERTLARACKALEPHQGALNARNNFRVEPVVLMMVGEPGTGKTMISQQLCATVLVSSGVLSNVKSADDVVKHIWAKGTSEYWNGYAGQACVVLDDAFQERVVAGNPDNSYMDIIRMVSTFAYPLNFADVESKGKIYFSSKFIYGSTNVQCITSEAGIVIAEPEAVERRLRYSYRLRVRPEYAESNGRLSIQAFNDEMQKAVQEKRKGLDGYPWHIWEVARHDYLRGITTETWMPLKDLVVEMSRELRARNTTHGAVRTQLSDYITGLVAQSSVDPIFDYEGADSIEEEDADAQSDDIVHLAQMVTQEERGLKSQVMSVLKVLGCTALLIVALKALIFLLKTMKKTICGILAFVFGIKKNKKKEDQTELQSVHNPVTIQRVNQSITLQSRADEVNAIYNNTHKLLLIDGSRTFILGQILFLEQGYAVFPTHFLIKMREVLAESSSPSLLKLIFRSSVNTTYRTEFPYDTFMRFPRVDVPQTDVSFINIKGMASARRITQFLNGEKDIRSFNKQRAVLEVLNVTKDGNLQSNNHHMTHIIPKLEVAGYKACGPVEWKRTILHTASTQDGDCGAPLCLNDCPFQGGRVFVGIHVAYDNHKGQGVATPVTSEMWEEAKKSLNADITDLFLDDLSTRVQCGIKETNSIPFSDAGSFLPMLKLEKGVSLCPYTSYYKTRFHGVLGPHELAPAHMRPVFKEGALVNPMENAVKPYSTPVFVYDQPWLEQAVHTALRPFNMRTKDVERRLFSFDEAVLGVPSLRFRSIPRNTAAGFPYVCTVKNGKKEFFGTAEEYDLSGDLCKELRARVQYVVDSARKGVRLSHVFVDFLKDELRTKAKVDAVATRLISSAPLDYTIAWRMYFGAFSAAAMSNNIDTGMAPGVCPYSDWARVASVMKSKGTKVFDGDFKGFDASEQPSILMLLLDVVNRWYDDGAENALVRKVLWMDLMYSRHIGGKGDNQSFIYQWNKSLPSGHPFTTIVNSMYSLTLLVGCYIAITGQPTNFWDHVFSLTYGDDNINNVSDTIAPLFNQVSVALAMQREFSVVYTSGRKDGNLCEYTTLDEVTFLKRRIIFDPVYGWSAPLELDSFYYTIYWCKNKKYEHEYIPAVLELALEELSLHDSKLWDSHSSALLKVMASAEHEPRCVATRDGYRKVVAMRTDAWF